MHLFIQLLSPLHAWIISIIPFITSIFCLNPSSYNLLTPLILCNILFSVSSNCPWFSYLNFWFLDCCIQFIICTQNGIKFADFLLVNFRFNFFWLVSKVDRSGWKAATHFSLSSLQGRNECWMNQSRFWESKTRRRIPGHPEIWILVDGTRDETRDVLPVSEYLIKYNVASSHHKSNANSLDHIEQN